MHVDSPVLAIFAIVMTVGILGLAVVRRRWMLGTLAATGVGCLLLAGSGIHFSTSTPGRVIALVDVSPSTRGASFRGLSTLRLRIQQLTGRTDVPIVRFSAGLLEGDDPSLSDVATARTALAAPDADALLLFGDGRLAWTPSRAQVFPVLDSSLAVSQDARIDSLSRLGDHVLTTIVTNEAVTLLSPDGASRRVEAPGAIVDSPAAADRVASAKVDSTDRWPENDMLTLAPAIVRATDKWWLGDRPAPAGFRALSGLPREESAWLAASIVVLDDVPIERLSESDQTALAHFVRELGGGLLIVGGDRALSAGGYSGTILDALSPLASAPPEPERRWVMLIDASGSMAAATADGRSKLGVASEAALAAARSLPPADRVDVATFSRDLRWLQQGAHPDSIHAVTGIDASGPTNLRAALEVVLASVSAGGLPVELIVLTDGAADLGDVASFKRELSDHRARLHVLGLSAIQPDSPLRQAASSIEQSLDPTKWDREVRALEQILMHRDLETGTARVEPWGIEIASWNLVWARDGVVELCRAKPQTAVLGARWSVGSGKVACVAFAAPVQRIEDVTESIQATPRDPHWQVNWEADYLSVMVEDDAGHPRTELSLFARIDAAEVLLKQEAPGTYSAHFARSGSARVGRLFVKADSERLVDVAMIPARYDEEFDRIGLDLPALQRIAAQTGGKVVGPDERGPIELPTRRSRIDVSAWLGLSGVVLTGFALIRWRRG